jgi:hypothetical protein
MVLLAACRPSPPVRPGEAPGAAEGAVDPGSGGPGGPAATAGWTPSDRAARWWSAEAAVASGGDGSAALDALAMQGPCTPWSAPMSLLAGLDTLERLDLGDAALVAAAALWTRAPGAVNAVARWVQQEPDDEAGLRMRWWLMREAPPSLAPELLMPEAALRGRALAAAVEAAWQQEPGEREAAVADALLEGRRMLHGLGQPGAGEATAQDNELSQALQRARAQGPDALMTLVWRLHQRAEALGWEVGAEARRTWLTRLEQVLAGWSVEGGSWSDAVAAQALHVVLGALWPEGEPAPGSGWTGQMVATLTALGAPPEASAGEVTTLWRWAPVGGAGLVLMQAMLPGGEVPASLLDAAVEGTGALAERGVDPAWSAWMLQAVAALADAVRERRPAPPFSPQPQVDGPAAHQGQVVATALEILRVGWTRHQDGGCEPVGTGAGPSAAAGGAAQLLHAWQGWVGRRLPCGGQPPTCPQPPSLDAAVAAAHDACDAPVEVLLQGDEALLERWRSDLHGYNVPPRVVQWWWRPTEGAFAGSEIVHEAGGCRVRADWWPPTAQTGAVPTIRVRMGVGVHEWRPGDAEGHEHPGLVLQQWLEGLQRRRHASVEWFGPGMALDMQRSVAEAVLPSAGDLQRLWVQGLGWTALALDRVRVELLALRGLTQGAEGPLVEVDATGRLRAPDGWGPLAGAARDPLLLELAAWWGMEDAALRSARWDALHEALVAARWFTEADATLVWQCRAEASVPACLEAVERGVSRSLPNSEAVGELVARRARVLLGLDQGQWAQVALEGTLRQLHGVVPADLELEWTGLAWEAAWSAQDLGACGRHARRILEVLERSRAADPSVRAVFHLAWLAVRTLQGEEQDADAVCGLAGLVRDEQVEAWCGELRGGEQGEARASRYLQRLFVGRPAFQRP